MELHNVLITRRDNNIAFLSFMVKHGHHMTNHTEESDFTSILIYFKTILHHTIYEKRFKRNVLRVTL